MSFLQFISNELLLFIILFKLYRDHQRSLSEAKRLKHAADAETDHLSQAILYLEAAVYFLLTSVAMERDAVTEKAAFTMYNDTLNLIRCVCAKLNSTYSYVYNVWL